MDYDPDFSKKSNAELNNCLVKYTEEHELYTRALSELSKRERSAEDKIKSQFSKAIFWSRLAAILALPGALFVFWQIFLTIHPLKIDLISEKQSLQRPKQKRQPSLNKQESSLSSLDTSTFKPPKNATQEQ
jgi:hypothetical protein